MSPKAAPNFMIKPKPVDPTKLAELEQLAEARGNGVAGSMLPSPSAAPSPAEVPAARAVVIDEPPQPSATLPDEAAPPAPQPAQQQQPAPRRGRGRPRRPEAASGIRVGTKEAPYVRADGIATRATTLHLSVALHKRLRREVYEREEHMPPST